MLLPVLVHEGMFPLMPTAVIHTYHPLILMSAFSLFLFLCSKASSKHTTSCCQVPATLSPAPVDTRQMQTTRAGPCIKMVLENFHRHHTAPFLSVQGLILALLVAVTGLDLMLRSFWWCFLPNHLRTLMKRNTSGLHWFQHLSLNIWSQWNNTCRHSRWFGTAANVDECCTHPYLSYVSVHSWEMIKGNRWL